MRSAAPSSILQIEVLLGLLEKSPLPVLPYPFVGENGEN